MEAVAHIRKSYAGTLTMADFWWGKFLDKLDKHDLWKNTILIVSSDHGHLLGEHNYWAKNYMMDYNELAHIPLIICAPDAKAGSRCNALTATIDIMPTIMELHQTELPPGVQGKSICPLLAGAKEHHDALLFGYFGKDVNLVDGDYTYCRQPIPGSPLYQYTAMPRAFSDFIPRDQLAKAETGVFLDSTHGVPHFRIKRNSKRHHNAGDGNPIYDLHTDPQQQHPIQNPELEKKLATKLTGLLERYNAPEEHFTRLGLR